MFIHLSSNSSNQSDHSLPTKMAKVEYRLVRKPSSSPAPLQASTWPPSAKFGSAVDLPEPSSYSDSDDELHIKLPQDKIKMWVIYWLIVMLLPTRDASAAAEVKPMCDSKCGNISIPYPFGIGDVNCALHSFFWLNCSSGSHELTLGEDTWVKNISVQNGTITISRYVAYDCYDESGQPTSKSRQENYLGPHFTFSATENKYIAIGCDTFGMVINQDFTYGASCLSICNEPVILKENSTCSGSGCCETSIARNLTALYISASSFSNHTKVRQFNPCGFSFLADKNSFKPSDWNLSSSVDDVKKKSDILVEWVVERIGSCDAAKANKSSYACGNNTNCVYFDSGEGYRCSCLDGFQGNPYLPVGCHDINECEEPERYRCSGKCKNTVGNYTCECPLGMHGDGKTGCQGFQVATIAAVVGASILLVIVVGLLYAMWMRRKKEQIFRQNGGFILKHQGVRLFSESELAKATKNYDKNLFLGEGGFGSVHKGELPDDTLIAVKKPKGLEKGQIDYEQCQREIGIVSRVNHKNVVKILGLCLETKVPLLVYEFISNGTLFQHIHNSNSQVLKSWRNRLRIAVETASALGYLHSLADPPIIHGDVKSMNILLDDNYTAKVSDFGASVLVSPDQKNMSKEKILGTFGYLDPEYLSTGILTEESDVYSFGVVLVELLTGEQPGRKKNITESFISALEKNELENILCFRISHGEMEEIEEFSDLAKRCLNRSGTKRPRMKEVAEGLDSLWKWHESVRSDPNDEETEHLLSGEIDETNIAGTFSRATFSLECIDSR